MFFYGYKISLNSLRSICLYQIVLLKDFYGIVWWLLVSKVAIFKKKFEKKTKKSEKCFVSWNKYVPTYNLKLLRIPSQKDTHLYAWYPLRRHFISNLRLSLLLNLCCSSCVAILFVVFICATYYSFLNKYIPYLLHWLVDI